jgi:acetolactate synthase-1/2/3 large subunit
LIIGTRLNPAITAYDETNFAPNAKKIIIDIDENEINKSSIRFELKIIMDAKNFIESFIEYKTLYKKTSRQSWLDYCVNIKNKYPIYLEKQVQEDNTKVDGYKFAEILSNHLTSNDIIVGSSSGRTCGISHMAIKLKENQKFISSMGLGSMGWCLPSAIACSIAGNKNRTILLEGDGSLQRNLQELALINTYKIPLKLFVLSNFGYASIYKMQENNFNSNYW